MPRVVPVMKKEYIFANFNVLMYAENYIFPMISAPNIVHQNRVKLSYLY